MSVLVKGMEKPEHCGYCRFRYDGICHALQKTQYSMNECPLVVIDDVVLNDTISRQAAIDIINTYAVPIHGYIGTPNDSEVYAYARGLLLSIERNMRALPSAQAEIKPIEYRDCANAMLRMWMDGVVTDGEYGRIMDKLNAYWRERHAHVPG